MERSSRATNLLIRRAPKRSTSAPPRLPHSHLKYEDVDMESEDSLDEGMESEDSSDMETEEAHLNTCIHIAPADDLNELSHSKLLVFTLEQSLHQFTPSRGQTSEEVVRSLKRYFVEHNLHHTVSHFERFPQEPEPPTPLPTEDFNPLDYLLRPQPIDLRPTEQLDKYSDKLFVLVPTFCAYTHPELHQEVEHISDEAIRSEFAHSHVLVIHLRHTMFRDHLIASIRDYILTLPRSVDFACGHDLPLHLRAPAPLTCHCALSRACDSQHIQYGEGEDSIPDISTLYKISTSMRKLKKFTNIKGQKMVFTNLDSIPAHLIPQAVEKVFDHFIKTSLESNGHDINKDKFSIAVYHPDFLTTFGNFFLPFRDFETNNGKTILRSINKIAKSNRKIDFSDVFEMDIYIRSGNAQNDAEFYKEMLPGQGFVDDTSFFDKSLQLPRVIKNSDNLCLARACAVAMAIADLTFAYTNSPIDNSIVKKLNSIKSSLIRSEKPQKTKALEILSKCNINTKLPFYTIEHLDTIASHYPEYKFILFKKETLSRSYSECFTANINAKKDVLIAFNDNHYDVFKRIKRAMNGKYCKHCNSSYNTSSTAHRCSKKCPTCDSFGCDKSIFNPIKCAYCNVVFNNQACFQSHKTLKSSAKKTICEKKYKCEKCDKYVIRANLGNQDHICNSRYCFTCRIYYCTDEPHSCTWQVPTQDQIDRKVENAEHFKILVYDVETVQAIEKTDENGDTFFDYLPEHYVNCIALSSFCYKCYNDPITTPCEKCGDKRRIFKYDDNDRHKPIDQVDKFEIVDKFLDYILYNKSFDDAYIFAHAGSRFDHHFMVPALIRRGIRPQLVLKGSKIITMTIKRLPKWKLPKDNHWHANLTWKCSLNLLPFPVSELPKCFNFEGAKGTYPYLYNEPANYGKVLNGPPALRYYNLEQSSPKKRQEIIEYWNSIQGKQWDANEQMELYVWDDVLILRTALIIYYKTFLQIAPPFNVLVFGTTFSSYTLFLLKHQHWKNGQIAVVNENGQCGNEVQSLLAIKMIRWLENKHKVNLQYKLAGGEKVIKDDATGKKYRVDAFHEPSNTVIEILGCVYHACITCYDHTAENPIFKKPNCEVYESTMARLERIRQLGYNVVEIWEHTIHEEMRQNVEMRSFFKMNRYFSRLVCREALQGGRTCCYKTFYETNQDEELSYLDFNSLYPYVCCSSPLVEGPPTILSLNLDAYTSGAEPLPFGVFLCDVLCPTDLKLPVVGVRLHNKLIFGSCRSCMETLNKGECTHRKVSERYIHATICYPELQLAISKGYKVLKIYEIYKWDWKDVKVGSIFSDFVMKMISIKQAASGFPSEIKTPEQRKAYIEDLRRDGYNIDESQIEFNPAKRLLAKLHANCCYGKLSEHPIKKETLILDVDDLKADNYIFDNDYELNSFEICPDERTIILTRSMKDENIPQKPFTQVLLAAMVTAHARCILYSAMDIVKDNLIYTDTDSLIFHHKKGKNPLEHLVGAKMGQLASEIPVGYRMTSVVCIAPKAYAYRLESLDGTKTVDHIKAKGITLDFNNRTKITMDSLKNLLDSYYENDATPIETERSEITRKLGKISTKSRTKNVQVVHNKSRVLFGDQKYETLPFGMAVISFKLYIFIRLSELSLSGLDRRDCEEINRILQEQGVRVVSRLNDQEYSGGRLTAEKSAFTKFRVHKIRERLPTPISISIQRYFELKYSLYLSHPSAPVWEMPSGELVPIEALDVILPNVV